MPGLVLGRKRRRHGAHDGRVPSLVALPRDESDDGQGAGEEEQVERREERLGRLSFELQREELRRSLRRGHVLTRWRDGLEPLRAAARDPGELIPQAREMRRDVAFQHSFDAARPRW